MRRRRLLQQVGIATIGTIGASSAAAADGEGGDRETMEDVTTEQGRYYYEELDEETIQEIERKIEAGEIEIGDVGPEAPDRWEPEGPFSIQAVLTDSERIYVEFADGDKPRPIELNTEMDGSFGNGVVNASWESDGSTEVELEENTYVSGVDPDASIGTSDTTPDELKLKSVFSIGGVSINISPSGDFETNSNSSAIYEETFTNTSEASHEYYGLEATAPGVLFNANQSDSATFTWNNESVTLNTEVNKF